MAEFPALPLYTDAYLADTRHLTTEEHGAYLLLLMCAWRTRGCALKDDDKHLARLVGVSLRRWQRMRPVLFEFFTVSQGRWQQKKLTSVYRAVAEKVERNRKNGAKGGRARAAKSRPEADSKALFYKEAPQAVAHGSPKPPESLQQATKPKTQNQIAEQLFSEESEGWDRVVVTDIAAASHIDIETLDMEVLLAWQQAGIDPVRDILPTINRLFLREKLKGRKQPKTLKYYDQAVLEAFSRRTEAGRGLRAGPGNGHNVVRIRFNPAVPQHWLTFLGDTDSRFQRDYISRHWLISHDHGLFTGGSLGPNPWQHTNRKIPTEIYRVYGSKWGWVERNST